MQKKRSQASMEYALIFGFALMMLMPLIVIYTSHKESVKDDVNVLQARKIVDSIVDNAEKVHFIGKPSMTTIEVRMPRRLENINISNNRISFKVRTSETVMDVYRYSDVNLSGNLGPGPGFREIVITAYDDYVNISSK